MKKISMETGGGKLHVPPCKKFKIKYLMTIDPKGPLRDRFSGSECDYSKRQLRDLFRGAECDDKKIRSSWLKYPRDTCRFLLVILSIFLKITIN